MVLSSVKMLLKRSSFVVLLSLSVASSTASKGKCEPLTAELCKEMRYNVTSMPNRFNHATQEEAALIMGSFKPLININCSPELTFLLCSM